MSTALALTDLRQIDGEPRVHDLKLGFALQMQNPYAVRRIITRNIEELGCYGEVFSTVAKTSAKGGRPTREYHLNEGQALLVCMFSATKRAAEVRHQLISVFMAWRRGELTPPAPVEPVMSAMQAAFAQVAERLAAVEAIMGFGDRSTPEKVAASVTYLPVWNSGRRPTWWGHAELRAFLVASHRLMTIDECRGEAQRRFGKAPSRSSIARFWQQLDEVRGLKRAHPTRAT